MENKIDESDYRADIELLTKFQEFSTEIARLSLLGIGIFGVLPKIGFDLSDLSYFVVFSLIAFSISTASALGHRYYSSDGIYFQLRYIRKNEEKDRKLRNERYKLSYKLLRISVIALALGSVALAIGFSVAVYSS